MKKYKWILEMVGKINPCPPFLEVFLKELGGAKEKNLPTRTFLETRSSSFINASFNFRPIRGRFNLKTACAGSLYLKIF